MANEKAFSKSAQGVFVKSPQGVRETESLASVIIFGGVMDSSFGTIPKCYFPDTRAAAGIIFGAAVGAFVVGGQAVGGVAAPFDPAVLLEGTVWTGAISGATFTIGAALCQSGPGGQPSGDTWQATTVTHATATHFEYTVNRIVFTFDSALLKAHAAVAGDPPPSVGTFGFGPIGEIIEVT